LKKEVPIQQEKPEGKPEAKDAKHQHNMEHNREVYIAVSKKRWKIIRRKQTVGERRLPVLQNVASRYP
jgi:hypothetical protein